MKWDEIKAKITFSNVSIGICVVVMVLILPKTAMLMGATADTISWWESRKGTVENVTIIGVGSISHVNGYSPASIRCDVILRGEPMARVSEADYYSIVNRDLPLNCTMRFGEGDELDAIISFEEGV